MKYVIVLFLLGLLSNLNGQEIISEPSIKKGMTKITILYPGGDGYTFDMEYYKTHHMPMLAEIYGDTMIKYEIDQGVSGRTPGEGAPYVAIGYMYFNKLSDYTDKFGPNANKILSDIPNYTNIQPSVQISEVIR